MKKISLVRLVFLIVGFFIANNLFAQHMLAIQSEDKQPFAANINGTAVSSNKTGSLRLSNLAAGTYNISITEGSTTTQAFACVIGKSDESYVFKNMPQKGWALKNLNSTEVITSSTDTKNASPATATAAALSSNIFAQMLAQVVNDPDLLKPTVWVYSNKVDMADVTAVPDESQNDTTPYVPATTGVIKASEELVKGGTEMVFVDFTATGGDTIHVLIPSADSSDGAIPAAQPSATNNSTITVIDSVKNQPHGIMATVSPIDSTIAPQQTTASKLDTASNGDVTLVTTPPPVQKKTVDTTAFAVDTATNKKMVNPFFDKSATSSQNSNNTQVNPPPSTSPNNNPASDALAAKVKTDCKKMLTDKEEDKLKHRIYLETDENKEMELTKKSLDGKCINTAQVKDLIGFFLSDEARLNFLQTVYPFVYDYGYFGALGTYLIDNKYKATFEAMLK